MRNFLFFWIFVLTTTPFFSQNLNIAEHKAAFYNLKDIVSINSNCYYLETSEPIGACCGGDVIVVKLNSAAQTSSIFGGPTISMFSLPKKMIKTSDHALFLLGTSIESCDQPGLRDFIVKVDTNGVIQFQTFIQANFVSGYPGEIKDIAQHIDSSFYLVSDSMLFHYSKTGQFISKINSGMKAMNSITSLGNGNFLVNGKKNGVLKNIEMTVVASVIQQQSSGSIISKFIQSPSGDLYGKTSLNFIERYSPNLTMINYSIGTFTSNLKINDFVYRNDSVYVTGINPNGNTPFYAILSQSLSTLFLTQAPYKNLTPIGIAINNKNKVYVITEGKSATNTYVKFKSVYQFLLTGNFASHSDIGVANAKLVSISNYVDLNNFSNPYIVRPTYNFDVVVKNYGNDTIQSASINYFWRPSFCDIYVHKECGTILPHDSVVVNTGNFYGVPYVIPVNTQLTDIIQQQVCFFTTVPDASNDIEINNDSGCGTFTLTGFQVGIQQNQLDETSSTIYPNPFSNELSVASPYEIKELTVMNALGETLFNQTVNDEKATFKNESLLPGFYFIKIETEKGTVTKKVLKN